MIAILSASVYQSPRYELPGIGSYLWQGAAVGALLWFSFPVMGLLSNDPYYGSLFLAALREYLACGIGFGLLEGAVIWACTFLTSHRLNAAVRAAIGMVMILLLIGIEFLLWGPSPYAKDVSATDSLINIGVFFVYGVIFGLLIGSRFDPLHELIRGTTPPRWGVLAAITGFILRIWVILFLMYSVLALTWILQTNFSRKEFTFAVIAVSHFIAAAVILFARMPFWLLLLLAIIVNFPIVVFVTDVLPEDTGRALPLVYLHLWAAFLFCRLSIKEQCNENRNNRRYWFHRQSSDNSTR